MKPGFPTYVASSCALPSPQCGAVPASALLEQKVSHKSQFNFQNEEVSKQGGWEKISGD